MTESMYPPAIGVRADLDCAHRRVWDHVSVVGEWWRAGERRAAAGIVRDAFNVREPSPPWSPASQDISRWSAGADILPAAIVDALYRMTVHATQSSTVGTGTSRRPLTTSRRMWNCAES